MESTAKKPKLSRHENTASAGSNKVLAIFGVREKEVTILHTAFLNFLLSYGFSKDIFGQIRTTAGGFVKSIDNAKYDSTILKRTERSPSC